MRLAFLVAPTDEFVRRLGEGGESGEPLWEATVVVTPKLEYERHFEGWRRLWAEKAKSDFAAAFTATWGGAENALGKIANELETANDPIGIFDRYWEIRQAEDVIEIAPEWRPNTLA